MRSGIRPTRTMLRRVSPSCPPSAIFPDHSFQTSRNLQHSAILERSRRTRIRLGLQPADDDELPQAHFIARFLAGTRAKAKAAKIAANEPDLFATDSKRPRGDQLTAGADGQGGTQVAGGGGIPFIRPKAAHAQRTGEESATGGQGRERGSLPATLKIPSGRQLGTGSGGVLKEIEPWLKNKDDKKNRETKGEQAPRNVYRPPESPSSMANLLQLFESDKAAGTMTYHPASQRFTISPGSQAEDVLFCFKHRGFVKPDHIPTSLLREYLQYSLIFEMHESKVRKGYLLKKLRGSLFGATHLMFRILNALDPSKPFVLTELKDDLLENSQAELGIAPGYLEGEPAWLRRCELSHRDARVFVESTQQELTLVWIAINAPLRIINHTANKLRHPTKFDRFATFFTQLCDQFKAFAKSDKGRKLWNPASLQRDFPVVFAFREQYLWFLWKGGIDDGVLVSQDSGEWIPLVDKVKRRDCPGPGYVKLKSYWVAISALNLDPSNKNP